MIAQGSATDRTIAFDGRLICLMTPHRHHVSLLDGVSTFCPSEKRLVAFKNVSRDQPVMEGHYPNDPLFPSTLLAEALAQASGLLMNTLWLMEHGIGLDQLSDESAWTTITQPSLSVLAESRIKFAGMARAGDQVQLESKVLLRRQEISYFAVRASIDGREIAQGEMMLVYIPVQL